MTIDELNAIGDRGEPAYPLSTIDGYSQYGMSLRQHYMGLLMQGFCANPAIFASNNMSGWKLVNCTEEALVDYAESIVDIMLAEPKL